VVLGRELDIGWFNENLSASSPPESSSVVKTGGLKILVSPVRFRVQPLPLHKRWENDVGQVKADGIGFNENVGLPASMKKWIRTCEIAAEIFLAFPTEV